MKTPIVAEIARIVVESLRVYGGRVCMVLDAAANDEEPDVPEALRDKRARPVL